MLWVLLIIVLLVLALGGLPTWPHMQTYNWGWYPSGGVGLILVILLILLLLGRL